jgi:hypothetical protein
MTDVVERQDVRVRQRGDRLRLALEASERVGVAGDALGQHLDRHFPLEPRVACPVDLAHPAGAERRDDLVRSQPRSGGESHFLPVGDSRSSSENQFVTR